MRYSSKSAGFTLIELMVVIAIAAIIATTGIASFISYNQTQIVKGAAEDVASLLLVARSRALSQVKPDVAPCSNVNQTLDGYKVLFNNPVADQYSLVAVCGTNNTAVLVTKKLPANVRFPSAPGVGFSPFFRTLNNSVDNATTIEVWGFSDSKKKNVKIDSDGAVNVN